MEIDSTLHKPNISTPKLHPQFSYAAYTIGREQTPLLVIDNFIHNAEELRDYCCNSLQLETIDTYYPGIRVAAPSIYTEAIFHYLLPLLQEVFQLHPSEIRGGKSLFSMVTTPPDQLEIKQCLPHVDSFKAGELACIHYLCGKEMGGTAMYRHRASGFETLNSERIDAYNQQLIDQGALNRTEKAYMHGSDNYFEQIAKIDAQFNRLIIYPTQILHSGNIPPTFPFTRHPTQGRLTLNSFIYRL